jgi:sec-independent protein translocase protein TatC
VLAAQLYLFVAPGLYRNERRAFLPFLIAAPVLFLIGGAIVFFVVMPLAVRFFLSMQQTGDIEIEALPDVGNYLHLTMTFILAFGLCFQLPVLLTLLARVGMVTSQWLRAQWRFAVVLIFVVAAVLAPPDVPSQVALAIPTLFLYEISILAVKLVERQRGAEDNATGNTSE